MCAVFDKNNLKNLKIYLDKCYVRTEKPSLQKYLGGKKKIIESDTAKTESSLRTLPLVPIFKNKLLALQEEQKKYSKFFGKAYNKKESRYIYTDQMGNRIRPDYFTQEFPEWLIANGFRRLRFHDLRHDYVKHRLKINLFENYRQKEMHLFSRRPLVFIIQMKSHFFIELISDFFNHFVYIKTVQLCW